MGGFCWQFITLAGFHCDALSIDLFAREYATRGAAAYVQLIQRQERENKVETLGDCGRSWQYHHWRHLVDLHHERRSHRDSVWWKALRSKDTGFAVWRTLHSWHFRRSRP